MDSSIQSVTCFLKKQIQLYDYRLFSSQFRFKLDDAGVDVGGRIAFAYMREREFSLQVVKTAENR
jgi:hypothetical protein